MNEFMINNNVIVSVYMYDGLMVHKNPILTEDFLRELEEVLYVNTNIQMKLKYKSTRTDWEPQFNDESEEETIQEDTPIFTKNFSPKKCRKIVEH